MSGLSSTSLFLAFDVNDERDNVLDAANNNDGGNVNKKFVNKREDTFDAMEDDGDNSYNNEIAPTDGFGFLQHFDTDLPFLFFCTHLLWGGCFVIHHGYVNE
jgi:hypothetical protein